MVDDDTQLESLFFLFFFTRFWFVFLVCALCCFVGSWFLAVTKWFSIVFVCFLLAVRVCVLYFRAAVVSDQDGRQSGRPVRGCHGVGAGVHKETGALLHW